MIIGIGTDICVIARIEKVLQKYGKKFQDRCFTKNERIKCNNTKNTTACYAKRFAAKEAVSKALGSGFSDGLQFCEIEVLSDLKGKPFLSFKGFADKKLKKLAKKNKSIKVDISMSNEKNYSIAIATISEII